MPSPHHRSHLNSSSLENGVWLTSNHEPAAHGRSYVGQLLDYFANSTDYSPSLLLDPPLDFNPNVPIDEDGHAALHWAAALGRIRMVGLLIESGADVLSINKAGHTALMRAVMSAVSDEFPALHRLLASSTMSRDSNHQTVLHHAMNLVLFTGETPAALHCIQTILHHLADCPAERAALLDFRNSNDETALMMASRCSSQPLFDLLAGFSINWETPEDQHSSFSGLPATRSLTPIDAASPTIMLSEPLVLAIEKRIRWAQSQGDREVSQATLDRLDQVSVVVYLKTGRV
jgi:transcription factor MBP1